jgi:hypothetical protein
MEHARQDYNAIQDSPLGTVINKDEPVFLLRAKDKFAPAIVREWANRIKAHDMALYRHVMIWADKMEQWQKDNKCQIPNTPEDQFVKLEKEDKNENS